MEVELLLLEGAKVAASARPAELDRVLSVVAGALGEPVGDLSLEVAGGLVVKVRGEPLGRDQAVKVVGVLLEVLEREGDAGLARSMKELLRGWVPGADLDVDCVD